MTEKIGRNDPCPCGSGKKYKACCLLKKSAKKKLTAKWLNAPAGPNLIERTFGSAISTAQKNPPMPPGIQPLPSKEQTASQTEEQ